MMSSRCPSHADVFVFLFFFYQEATYLVVGFKMFTSHHGGGNVYIALYRMKIAVLNFVAWYCIICHIESVETGLVAALTFIQRD